MIELTYLPASAANDPIPAHTRTFQDANELLYWLEAHPDTLILQTVIHAAYARRNVQ